jgi:hypothetical protein
MPNNNLVVGSGYPQLPFFINDHGLDSLFSITIASGTGVLVGGTVLGKRNTGTHAGKYQDYDNGASDGTEVARGILLNRVDATSGDALGSMMIHGVVRSGSLIGWDSNAASDLPNIQFR